MFRLSFDYQFEEEDDEVFFAYCIPYTYGQLQQDIKQISHSPFVRKFSIGLSLSGLDIPLLFISDHEQREEEQAKKKTIVVTGRIHPGETNGSHMVKGFIDALLGDTLEAQQLRKKHNIFVVPMMNPDGVVLGNTRTSTAGRDLNRQFTDPEVALFPEVHHIKKWITKLQKKTEIALYLDFHGHSRRKNTFFYGPNYPIQHL